jgi:hypothetical protein
MLQYPGCVHTLDPGHILLAQGLLQYACLLSEAWTVLSEKHLYSSLEAAKEKEDEEAACQIVAIIQ